ncbi:hypothetical protein C0J52_23953 [Blattella germanica]|nr:hypothetical protein C0J52_23953 [Blattella germanica]
MIWAQIKGEVADRNNSFKLADVEKLLQGKRIDNTTVEQLSNCVRHAEQLQEDVFHKQINRDQNLKQIVINLEDDSESIGVGVDEGHEEEENASEQLATPLL